MLQRRLREAIAETEPSTTRRVLVESAALAGVGGVSGCLEESTSGVGSTDTPTGQQTAPDLTVPGADILVTTDGETVYAIENRKGIAENRAIDRGRVVAEDEDTGVVMQAVLDEIRPRQSPAGDPIDPANPPGRHIHFSRGLFRWQTGAVTNGANEIRITGNWWGTDWVAEDSMRAFIQFTEPQIVEGHHVGPQISYLLVHGNDNAEHLLTLAAHTDDTHIHDITCFGTKTSMIYGQADSQSDDFEFKDTSYFYNLRSLFGGALAILEDGPSGIVTDCRFENCFCAYPDTYGLILRNVQRIVTDFFFTGIRGGGDPGDGGVLVENPPMDFGSQPDTQQCWFHMVEIEDPEERDNPPVHVRAPEGAETLNRNHTIVFPRGGHSYRLLTAEAEQPGQVREIELRGAQLPPNRPDSVLLRNAQDCRIQFTNGVANPRELVTIEGGARNTINGVGTNPGNPAQTGPWNDAAYEGVTVWDTESQECYRNVNGGWFRLAGEWLGAGE